MTNFLDEMDQLAGEIAKTAREVATSLSDKIDAFRALTPYYVQKIKKPKTDDSDDLPTFENFSDRIHGLEVEKFDVKGTYEIIESMETDNGEGKSGLRSSWRNGD